MVPGESAEFIAIVQANPEPNVTWSKDGQIVKEKENLRIIKDIANKTYKLIFDTVTLADEGHYKIIAKNELGETSSEAALRTFSKYYLY